MNLTRHQLHILVVLLEEKIDKFVQHDTLQSLKSAAELGRLRKQLQDEFEKKPKK